MLTTFWYTSHAAVIAFLPNSNEWNYIKLNMSDMYAFLGEIYKFNFGFDHSTGGMLFYVCVKFRNRVSKKIMRVYRGLRFNYLNYCKSDNLQPNCCQNCLFNYEISDHFT